MSNEAQCPECGGKLPAETPEGLCPACLLRRGLETQAAGSAPDLPSPTPEALAAYFSQLEIAELLGRGGMGAVYKARHKGLDRWVALKVLPAMAQRDPAFAERFTREARALAKLDHPNIVTVHDSGETNGLFYFIMEYVDGANLRQVLASGGVTPEQALAIVPQICDALQYAHKQGIVHRDIKPENILVDKSGHVKIADFGIAKIVGREAQDFTLTSMGDVVGTPAYMAPEQVEHPSEVDHRADIYSLGVVFYQMLTGELPLGRFAPPSRKVHIDVRLDEVVLRALEKEPDRRYQQAGEVKTEVETIAGTPGSAGTERPKAYPWNRPVNYRSRATLFGLPLVHITQGTDPTTGRKLVARGIIAIGDIAQGVIAIGGCAMGGIALGGAAFGVISVGGLALGLWAFAGLALGLIGAWGGLALAPIAMGGTAMGYFAKGGRAIGMHVWDSITKDPEAVRFFQDSWSQKFLDWMPITSPIFGFVIFAIAWGSIEWAKARENRRTGKKTRWWLGLLQFASALLILALFGVSIAISWTSVHQRQQPARSTTSVNHEHSLSFGPAIEQTVAMESAMDLDTGKLATPPKSVSGENDIGKFVLGLYKWLEQQGMDVYISSGPDIGAVDMKVAILKNDAWETITVEQLFQALESAKKETFQPLNHGKDSPVTYAFQTREGGIGILQILGFNANDGAKIRYKIVQNMAKPRNIEAVLSTEQSPIERFQATLQDAVDRKDKAEVLALINQDGIDAETMADLQKSILPLFDRVFSWPRVKVKCERRSDVQPESWERNGKQYALNGKLLMSASFQNTDPAHNGQGPVFQAGLTPKGMRILLPVEASQPSAQWAQNVSGWGSELLSVHGVAANAGPDTKDYPLTSPSGQTETVHLEKPVLLDWLNVRSVKPEPDGNGVYTLKVTLDEEGTRKFAEITARRLEKQIGFVVDGRLLSAPRVKDPIFGGNFSVGNLPEQEARDLAAKLTKAIGTGMPEPSATPTPSPSPVPGSSAPSQDMKTRAVAFVDLLAKGDFAKARAEFDTTMSGAMSEQMLGTVWAQLGSGGGKYLGHDAPREEAFQEFIIVYVPCRWERMQVDLKIV